MLTGMTEEDWSIDFLASSSRPTFALITFPLGHRHGGLSNGSGRGASLRRAPPRPPVPPIQPVRQITSRSPHIRE